MASAYDESFGDTLKKFAPGIIAVLGVVILLFALIFGFRWYLNRDESNTDSGSFVRSHNIKLGKADSNIQFIYGIDHQCPGCAAFDPVFKQVYDANKDKVQFVIKQFPLTQIHPQAKPAAYGALAVAKQNPEKYLDYKTTVFESVDRLNSTVIEDTVRGLDGIDYEQWDDYRKSSEVRNFVDEDEADFKNTTLPASSYEGGATKAPGTPMVIIAKDGVLIDWWQGSSYEENQTRIDKILNS